MKAAYPTRVSDIFVKDIGGETVLYRAEQGEVHVLNATAKLIWELCDGAHSLTDMSQVMREHFSVPDDHDVLNDIQQTLDVFAGKGLLQTMN